jgi:CBS domain-containing protein
MKIHDLMNVNATRIRAGATVRQAAEVLSGTQASDLMVVDDDNGFVGVLSEGDLIRAALPRYDEILSAGGGSLSDAFETFVDNGRALADGSIARLVIKAPITISPGEDVLKAAGTMISHQIRRLPVVADGKLVGTVSRADICRAVLGA